MAKEVNSFHEKILAIFAEDKNGFILPSCMWCFSYVPDTNIFKSKISGIMSSDESDEAKWKALVILLHEHISTYPQGKWSKPFEKLLLEQLNISADVWSAYQRVHKQNQSYFVRLFQFDGNTSFGYLGYTDALDRLIMPEVNPIDRVVRNLR